MKHPGPTLFILNKPAICRRRNVKLVKLETFFFTIITRNNAITQGQCDGMAYHRVSSATASLANSIRRGWSAAGHPCLLVHRFIIPDLSPLSEFQRGALLD